MLKSKGRLGSEVKRICDENAPEEKFYIRWGTE